MSAAASEDDKSVFLNKLRDLEGYAGNTTLRRELGWKDGLYWRIHAALVDEGKVVRGKGKGGSISLVEQVNEDPQTKQLQKNAAVSEPSASSQKEYDLYKPVVAMIKENWIRERGYDDYVAEITAYQGRKPTGGTWTRPDVALLAIKAFQFLPGRHFDIVTFEIKKEDSVDVTGVFEALSHLQFASLAYVVFCTNGKDFENDYRDTERILSLAKIHGVGVISASDASDYDTWDPLVEPRRNVPDPEQANLFIGTCFPEEARTRAIKWHK